MKKFFKLILQLHGGGGTTVNQSNYTPTAQEVHLQQNAADYSDYVLPNAMKLNDVAGNLLYDSLGTVQVDYSGLNNNAQGQIANAQNTVNGLANGELPSAYTDNMNKVINTAVQNSVGNTVNSLGSKGVLNSSVTTKALSDTSTAAANAAAENYLNSISTVNGLAGQQASLAGQGITTAAAAQQAAQQPALNLWNASLGLNQANTGALGAVSGQGTTTSTQTTSGSGLFGGLIGGIASSVACFTADTKIEVPDNDFVNIDKLRAGDEVICRNAQTGLKEKATITEVLKPTYQNVYTVVCEGDNFVSTTLTQPLMQKDGKWILVSDLTAGKELMDKGKVLSIIFSGERKVYDLKLTGDNAYYANGFIAKGGTNEWGEVNGK